jgi:hypothetical protein
MPSANLEGTLKHRKQPPQLQTLDGHWFLWIPGLLMSLIRLILTNQLPFGLSDECSLTMLNFHAQYVDFLAGVDKMMRQKQ